MELNFFILGGYGQFVWPSFIFSFAICYYFYFKTKRELKKQEEIFLNEFGKIQTVEIKTIQKKKNTKEALPSGAI